MKLGTYKLEILLNIISSIIEFIFIQFKKYILGYLLKYVCKLRKLVLKHKINNLLE